MPDCPYLGWDPAPGSPAAVAALRTKLATAAESLGTAHRLVSRLVSDDTAWRGEGAAAFRASLDGGLTGALHDAHRSLTEAARRLGRWHDDLLSLQATARRCDTDAATARAALAHAKSHHARLTASADPPPAALHAAGESLTSAEDALASILHRARELEAEHRAEARQVARCLDEATVGLAPEEPGLLDRAVEWVREDLGDLLSDVSALAGFLALVIGPFLGPVGLALMFVGAGASLGALTLHLADAKTRASLQAGFTKGEVDADFWDSAVTLAGDALGSVPGVAAIAQGTKAATTAVQSARAAAAPGTVDASGTAARGFGRGAVAAMEDMRQVENPFTAWALQRAPEAVKTSVKYAFPASGALTAASHHGPWSESDSVSEAATAVDGTRAVLDDGPGSAAKAAHVWATLTR
ncbi:hypothetical protein [Streptomyces yaizuensis]|uniref:WXG100 family type VII secretion target n=1 Tax=Streptomyces yaizuensis TaxID=2989713 RepID=A0ABQ5P738_9ACTN|nr:hypothetical protein [Streptomyces sp. YSPA8]GLF98401.1 WXG100 family type VII secretion target [Streptomyces sp. YSPA8]